MFELSSKNSSRIYRTILLVRNYLEKQSPRQEFELIVGIEGSISRGKKGKESEGIRRD